MNKHKTILDINKEFEEINDNRCIMLLNHRYQFIYDNFNKFSENRKKAIKDMFDFEMSFKTYFINEGGKLSIEFDLNKFIRYYNGFYLNDEVTVGFILEKILKVAYKNFDDGKIDKQLYKIKSVTELSNDYVCKIDNMLINFRNWGIHEYLKISFQTEEEKQVFDNGYINIVAWQNMLNK